MEIKKELLLKIFIRISFIIFLYFIDETRLFEAFSTYKIFTLELISIFCNLRVSRQKIADILKTISGKMILLVKRKITPLIKDSQRCDKLQ